MFPYFLFYKVLRNSIDKMFTFDMLKITKGRTLFVENVETNQYENIKEG